MPKSKSYNNRFNDPVENGSLSEDGIFGQDPNVPVDLRNIPPSPDSSLIKFRPYQRAAFENRTHGIEVWCWARQTGKSFTLAAWAVDRLLTIPGRTVTVLSNSKFNGMELNLKCAEICNLLGKVFHQVDLSPDDHFETMRAETRITVAGRTGRIIILAANVLTARGFSGDLILDEFAFHKDSAAIWNEAKPILNANKTFLCRIASTPNGKHNQFYRMVTGSRYFLRKITRTDAYAQGCPVYDDMTREEITPARARELDPDKRAYDQSYECVFENDNSVLLTHELINAAERPAGGFICEAEWSKEAVYLSTVRPGDRATEFKQRCDGLNISGVSLHSYRYAWAQRAKECGYPERFAQQALGHNSKAVHRYYARTPVVKIPSLEQYEAEQRAKGIITATFGNDPAKQPEPSNNQRVLSDNALIAG